MLLATSGYQSRRSEAAMDVWRIGTSSFSFEKRKVIRSQKKTGEVLRCNTSIPHHTDGTVYGRLGT